MNCCSFGFSISNMVNSPKKNNNKYGSYDEVWVSSSSSSCFLLSWIYDDSLLFNLELKDVLTWIWIVALH